MIYRKKIPEETTTIKVQHVIAIISLVFWFLFFKLLGLKYEIFWGFWVILSCLLNCPTSTSCLFSNLCNYICFSGNHIKCCKHANNLGDQIKNMEKRSLESGYGKTLVSYVKRLIYKILGKIMGVVSVSMEVLLYLLRDISLENLFP